MDTLALKLVLTPLLIGAASLAGRRWGPGVSGWLVGIPFTSGPVAFFLALDYGPAFAASAAAGTLAGTIAQAAFCLAYARLAGRRRWVLALAGGSLAFAACTATLGRVPLALIPLCLAVIVCLPLVLWLMPAGAATTDGRPHPRWDLPARMVLATLLVLLLTALAPTLGPRATGLLSPYPLYAGILAIFAQRLQGPAAAVGVLRGLAYGLFAFGGFFAVLTVALERIGIGAAFALALAAAVALQAGSLWALRRALRERTSNAVRARGSTGD